MRRMFSKNQVIDLIKNNIEDNLSNVTVTKGEYTTDISIKITKVGHCTTMAGIIGVNNTSGSAQDLQVSTFQNLPLSINVDADEFSLIQEHNHTLTFAHGYILIGDEPAIIFENVPENGSTYYFDIDIIDDSVIPVKDYPGE